jgi:hypothetical protein
MIAVIGIAPQRPASPSQRNVNDLSEHRPRPVSRRTAWTFISRPAPLRPAPRRTASHRPAARRSASLRNATQRMDMKMVTEQQDVEFFQIRDVTITVAGITPYSQSRETGEDKEKSETWDDYEARVWRKKIHHTSSGDVFIPGAAFKLCIDEATSNLNEKIPGKGNQTWSGVFRMGIAPLGNMMLGVKAGDVRAESVFCHANGKRGPGTRVTRLFPMIDSWGGSITMRIFNDNITAEKFEEFFAKAGVLAGVGRGRPSTGCPMGNGRFRPKEFSWSKVG